MDGILINRNTIKQWVESFVNSDNNETDKHIDDFAVTSVPKNKWIMYAINIYTFIKEYYPDIKVIVLIHQKCRYKELCSVKASQFKDVFTPPSIILYKGALSSVLFDDVIYSDSISNKINMNAYIRNDNGEWDVFLTE